MTDKPIIDVTTSVSEMPLPVAPDKIPFVIDVPVKGSLRYCVTADNLPAALAIARSRCRLDLSDISAKNSLAHMGHEGNILRALEFSLAVEDRMI